MSVTDPIHACFISYRHPAASGGREEKLIRHVVKAISDHVQMYTHDHKIYFDENRLVAGYQYNEQLAEAICRSACMVVVYWPSYLESDYCQKEIRAMLDIEDRRRKQLGGLLHGCRLFIPVILRGKFEELPAQIRDGCHYLDYKAQATKPDVNVGDDEAMSEQLYRVAEYIKSLCDKMKSNHAALFGGCDQFSFPGTAEPGQASLAAPPFQLFPGRS